MQRDGGVGMAYQGLGLAELKCWQLNQAGQLVVLLAQDAAMQLRQKTQDKWESE